MTPRQYWRYGQWAGGKDPLENPYDVRKALDEMADDVLSGNSAREALNRLLRRGADGRPGLDDLRRQARDRARDLRRQGKMDGTLLKVKELLEKAVEQERHALFPDPDDSARLAEAELDQLPSDPARAVQELQQYNWRSPEAAQTFQEIQDLLRKEVLDSQFKGMKDALENASQQDMEQIRQMMSDLNDMLDSDAKGEHTPEQFQEFMDKHGEYFPENPQNLEELVDQLARRAAAQARLMDSLTPQQRAELGDLMAQALGQAGLSDEMSRLQANLKSARPDLRWGGRERMQGEGSMGMSDATSALAELGELDELSGLFDQNYPGATLDDVDDEMVERALGSAAVDNLAQLREIERELQKQGYLQRTSEGLTLTPRALRRLGSTALRRVFADLASRGRGGHDVRNSGAAGETTGASRAWEFGDEQPLDVVRTVRNAVLRSASSPAAPGSSGKRRVQLSVDDFEIAETERRTSTAVALLVDMSYSMELRGTWGEAKTTALALHSLITTKYPQDAIQIIGFSDYARVLTPAALAGHSWDMVQGTNLQHALILARRFLDSHRNADPTILVITDGEPTAHIAKDGFATFAWPPTRETLAATLAEVERATRRGATINVFMLDDDPRLIYFMQEVARRNGGRLFEPKPGRLGEFVVSDYITSRGAKKRKSA
ncbi:MAG: von Willebrand factor type [Pseudonocardiales bacterium]|nr:von Willebrand factor type [Pseudonocardiales bacterium]